MAQVPMRMAQPGLIPPPHQQRPHMMVSMAQPPASMQAGLVSMAPMMAPAGGMAVMSHPDSHTHDHINFHPHHPHAHHSPHGPPGHPGHHHPNGPTHPGGPPLPPHTGPPHSQYHPGHHPTGPHLPSHNHHGGPHHTAPQSGVQGGPHSNTHVPHSLSHNGPHSGMHGRPHCNSLGALHSGSHNSLHSSIQGGHHPASHGGTHSGTHSVSHSQNIPHISHHSGPGPHIGHHSTPVPHGGHHSMSIQHTGHHSTPVPHMGHPAPNGPHGGHHSASGPNSGGHLGLQSSHSNINAYSGPQSGHHMNSQSVIQNAPHSLPQSGSSGGHSSGGPQMIHNSPQQLVAGSSSICSEGGVRHGPSQPTASSLNQGQQVTHLGNTSHTQLTQPQPVVTQHIHTSLSNGTVVPSHQLTQVTSADGSVSLNSKASTVHVVSGPPNGHIVSVTSAISVVNGISSLSAASLSASKEKTPMCLVNELARHNKIQHQYSLTDEKGPAHKKTFTVTLRLSNTEEYTASGPSIKKAQHAAASIALEKTQFKHPPPRTQKLNKQTKLTPTVELNALAMKRGETPTYTFLEPPRPPNHFAFNIRPDPRTMYNQKYYGRTPLYPVFYVSLHVGSREFEGEGPTAQQAKHNAASKALKAIKALPLPEPANTCSQGDLSDLDPNADLKSPISLVHEVALKRNLTVQFEVIRENGPPHMRTFVTVCMVGELRTEGEGTGKKVSKKRAAELMLEELRMLPPLPPTTLTRLKRKPTTKKKSRNLIKEQKAAPDYGQGINPISRLIQIQQAKKEKEPVYTLLHERGVPRRREFVMQVTVGSHSAQGSGPNKKLAKRAAAEAMLQILGYSRPQPQPSKPAIKSDSSHTDPEKMRKVTFLEEGAQDNQQNQDLQVTNGSIAVSGPGRQLVPGLIMMPDGPAMHGYQQQVNMKQVADMQQTAMIAKELLVSGNSPTAEAIKQKSTSNGPVPPQKCTTPPPAPPPLPQSTTPATPPTPATLHNSSPPHSHALSPPQQSRAKQQQQLPLSSHTQQPPSPAQLSNQQTPSIQIVNQNINVASSPPSSANGEIIHSDSSQAVVRPTDQLYYLAHILGIQLQFTDFPKGNKSEFLSLVSLSTKPPLVSHGAGPTKDASRDQACLNALRALAEMGLDTVTANGQEDYGQAS